MKGTEGTIGERWVVGPRVERTDGGRESTVVTVRQRSWEKKKDVGGTPCI